MGDDFCDRPNELGDVYETYYKYFVVDRYRYNTKDILNKERKYSNLSSDWWYENGYDDFGLGGFRV